MLILQRKRGFIMKNYLIVTDSTSAFTLEEAKQLQIEMIPLTLIVEGIPYLDNIEMDNIGLYNEIRKGNIPTTSQPSIGLLEELMQEWKAKQYDAILLFTVSSGLSGTYSALLSAKEQVGIDELIIVDTRTVGASMKDIAMQAKIMADAQCSVEEILAMAHTKMNHTFSFLYPKDFVQLKKGGRVTPAAANIANLLKIKPLLYLADQGRCVDKFSLARTNKKIIDTMIAEFKKQNITAAQYKFYILEADTLDNAYLVESELKKHFDNIECEIIALPAVLTCQGGLGCLAVQTVYKV